MQANNDFPITHEMSEPPAVDTVITIYDDNVSDVDDDASPPDTFETWLDLLTEPEIEQLEETVLELMEDCIYGQLIDMVDPKFYKNICNDLIQNGYTQIPLLSSTTNEPKYNFKK